jgi:hypothetical protein
MTSQCIRRHTGLEYSIEMVYRTEYSLVIAIEVLVQVADQYGRLQQLESCGDLAELRLWLGRLWSGGRFRA